MTYISWSIDFALRFEDFLTDEQYNLGWIIISQYDATFWPENKCRSQWLIFHGPVILLYILDINLRDN